MLGRISGCFLFDNNYKEHGKYKEIVNGLKRDDGIFGLSKVRREYTSQEHEVIKSDSQ